MLNRNKIPIFPLQAVLFPGMTIQLNIFEPRYLKLVEDCIRDHSPFGAVLILEGSEVARPNEKPPTIARIGCLARITRSDRLADERYTIEAKGGGRFRIEEITSSDSYITGRVTMIGDEAFHGIEVENLRQTVSDGFRSHITNSLAKFNRTVSTIHLPDDPTALSFAIGASMNNISLRVKQDLLEAPSTRVRLEMEAALLNSFPVSSDEPKVADEMDAAPLVKKTRSKISRTGSAKKLDLATARKMLSLN